MAGKLNDPNVCKMTKNDSRVDCWVDKDLTEEAKPNSCFYHCLLSITQVRRAPEVCSLIPFKEEYRRQDCRRNSNEVATDFLLRLNNHVISF